MVHPRLGWIHISRGGVLADSWFDCRETSLPDDWSHDEIDRNGTGKRIQFKFLQAQTQKWFGIEHPELRLDSTLNCPYIFIDPPSGVSTNWTLDDWKVALAGAKTRTSAPQGMVVAIAHPTQVAACFEAMRVSISEDYIPHIMTCNIDNSKVVVNDFPRKSLLVLVQFWGPARINESGQSSSSSTAPSQSGMNKLPLHLILSDSFLQFGLTDLIMLPKPQFWQAEAPPKSVVGFKPGVVDINARPLELYLYFLNGFLFPGANVPGTVTVFDLCAGSGTASLAASMCSMHSLGIEIDLVKVHNCKLRLYRDVMSVHQYLKSNVKAHDYFVQRPRKITDNHFLDDDEQKKNWMQVDSFLDRLQVANSTRAKEEDKEDQDADMEDQDDDEEANSMQDEGEETVVDSGTLPRLRLHTDP